MKEDSPVNFENRSQGFLPVLARMITSELMKTFVAVIGVLLLILISKQFASILQKAFTGEIANETIALLVSLKLISVAIYLLPSAMFASVLIVLGRMYRDNEMAALAASGVGTLRMYLYVLLLVVPLAIMGAVLSMQVMPWTVKQTTLVLLKERQTSDLRLLVAGRFNEYSRGDIVFYVEEISSDNQMHNIFVQHRKDGELSIVLSKRGYVKVVENVRFLVLVNGHRYQGNPGDAEFEITEFSEYAVAIGENAEISINWQREAKSSTELWESEDPSEIAEFHKRVSIPLGMLILSILAVPLAKVSPRGGVYGNIMMAFLVFLIYKNLLSIAQSWLIGGKIPIVLGYWWVYMLMLVLAAVLLIRGLGWTWCLRFLSGRSERLNGSY